MATQTILLDFIMKLTIELQYAPFFFSEYVHETMRFWLLQPTKKLIPSKTSV